MARENVSNKTKEIRRLAKQIRRKSRDAQTWYETACYTDMDGLSHGDRRHAVEDPVFHLNRIFISQFSENHSISGSGGFPRDKYRHINTFTVNQCAGNIASWYVDVCEKMRISRGRYHVSNRHAFDFDFSELEFLGNADEYRELEPAIDFLVCNDGHIRAFETTRVRLALFAVDRRNPRFDDDIDRYKLGFGQASFMPYADEQYDEKIHCDLVSAVRETTVYNSRSTTNLMRAYMLEVTRDVHDGCKISVEDNGHVIRLTSVQTGRSLNIGENGAYTDVNLEFYGRDVVRALGRIKRDLDRMREEQSEEQTKIEAELRTAIAEIGVSDEDLNSDGADFDEDFG